MADIWHVCWCGCGCSCMAHSQERTFDICEFPSRRACPGGISGAAVGLSGRALPLREHSGTAYMGVTPGRHTRAVVDAPAPAPPPPRLMAVLLRRCCPPPIFCSCSYHDRRTGRITSATEYARKKRQVGMHMPCAWGRGGTGGRQTTRAWG
jgi:hypothetical protein